MTLDEALATLGVLLEQAQKAVAAGDTAAGEAVALQAIRMPYDPSTPATHALFVGYSKLGSLMNGLVRPQATGGLFSRAAQACQQAPDATIDDHVAALHNLAAVQLQAKDPDASDTLTALARLAASSSAPINDATVVAFLQHGRLSRANQQYAAMMAFDEQVLRHLLAHAWSDDSQAGWFNSHLAGLREAGRVDRVLPDIERVEAAFAGRNDRPLTLRACMLNRASLLNAQEDYAGAAVLVDHAAEATGQPAEERLSMLTTSARLWFNAGDFERSADRARQAVRLRVGLAD